MRDALGADVMVPWKVHGRKLSMRSEGSGRLADRGTRRPGAAWTGSGGRDADALRSIQKFGKLRRMGASSHFPLPKFVLTT